MSGAECRTYLAQCNKPNCTWAQRISERAVSSRAEQARGESKCCDAVLRVLENHMEVERTELHEPDKINNDRKRVDVCVKLGADRYVLEHTRIEPFENMVETGVLSENFFNGVRNHLSISLPGPARYEISLPHNPQFDRGGRGKSKRLVSLQKSIANWVSNESFSLYDLAGDSNFIAASPALIEREFPSFPGYFIRLSCILLPGKFGTEEGALSFVRDAPESDCLEIPRVERINKALSAKCLKLQFCKNCGARTVLVLENFDIALSNDMDVHEALISALENRDDPPDEIYLVDTKSEEQYYVFPMNLCARGRLGNNYHKFEAENLTESLVVSHCIVKCKFCGLGGEGMGV